jgi:hypothetical protein
MFFDQPLHSTPSIGAILGTAGNAAVIDMINSSSGFTTYFGTASDPFAEGYKHFKKHVIEPIKSGVRALKEASAALFNSNRIRPITSVEELSKGIPTCMYDVFALHESVKDMILQGRVDGFGLNHDYVKERENYWKRLAVDNGSAIIGYEKDNKMTVNDKMELKWEWHSSDPDYTIDDLDGVEQTIRFIAEFYSNDETKKLDITDYPNEHG